MWPLGACSSSDSTRRPLWTRALRKLRRGDWAWLPFVALYAVLLFCCCFAAGVLVGVRAARDRAEARKRDAEEEAMMEGSVVKNDLLDAVDDAESEDAFAPFDGLPLPVVFGGRDGPPPLLDDADGTGADDEEEKREPPPPPPPPRSPSAAARLFSTGGASPRLRPQPPPSPAVPPPPAAAPPPGAAAAPPTPADRRAPFRRSVFVEPERTPVLYLGDDDSDDGSDGEAGAPPTPGWPAPPPFVPQPPPLPPPGAAPTPPAFPPTPGSPWIPEIGEAPPAYVRRSPRRLFM